MTATPILRTRKPRQRCEEVTCLGHAAARWGFGPGAHLLAARLGCLSSPAHQPAPSPPQSASRAGQSSCPLLESLTLPHFPNCSPNPQWAPVLTPTLSLERSFYSCSAIQTSSLAPYDLEGKVPKSPGPLPLPRPSFSLTCLGVFSTTCCSSSLARHKVNLFFLRGPAETLPPP